MKTTIKLTIGAAGIIVALVLLVGAWSVLHATPATVAGFPGCGGCPTPRPVPLPPTNPPDCGGFYQPTCPPPPPGFAKPKLLVNGPPCPRDLCPIPPCIPAWSCVAPALPELIAADKPIPLPKPTPPEPAGGVPPPCPCANKNSLPTGA